MASAKLFFRGDCKGRCTVGLFDFAAEFGKKLFGKDDDTTQKIQQEMKKTIPAYLITGIEYQNGAVALFGKANSADALEKSILTAGNLEGVHAVGYCQ